MTEPVAQLVRGTLHILILRTLVGGPLHGYAIASAIADRSHGVLEIEDGALYQALHRMEAREWLASAWGVAESGRRARFYSLTAKGRQRLREETDGWAVYSAAVSRVLAPTAA